MLAQKHQAVCLLIYRDGNILLTADQRTVSYLETFQASGKFNQFPVKHLLPLLFVSPCVSAPSPSDDEKVNEAAPEGTRQP